MPYAIGKVKFTGSILVRTFVRDHETAEQSIRERADTELRRGFQERITAYSATNRGLRGNVEPEGVIDYSVVVK